MSGWLARHGKSVWATGLVAAIVLLLVPIQSMGLTSGILVADGVLEAVGKVHGANPCYQVEPGGLCTGTLISQHVVLTAAHCLCFGEPESAQCTGGECLRATFVLTDVYPVDNPATAQDESLTRKDISIQGDVYIYHEYGFDQHGGSPFNHPHYDFALIILDRPVNEVALGVSPIDVAAAGEAPAVGDLNTLVGFGWNGQDCLSSPSGKRQQQMVIDNIREPAVEYWDVTESICGGDSGGPAINGDGKIIGVCSKGWPGEHNGQPIKISAYRPTYDPIIFDWIAGAVRSWDPGPVYGGSDQWRVSSGTSSDLDSKRSLYQYYPAEGKAHTDVAGMALSSGDDSFVWYTDYTVSAGSTKDLDSGRSLYTYTLPPGKTPYNIVGIGGHPDGYVIAWYDDWTFSKGYSGDLDALQGCTSFSLPSVKAPGNIVGMGIAENGDCYAWYDDKSVSAGTAGDLDSARSLYSYSLPPGMSPAGVVGMGISPVSGCYVWFGPSDDF